MTKRLLDKSSPLLPAGYDIADVKAFKNLAAGEATADQQKRALNWIIMHCAGTYDQPFRPGGAEGARDTDFAAGKQFVGQQIVKLVNMDLLAMQETQQTKRKEK